MEDRETLLPPPNPKAVAAKAFLDNHYSTSLDKRKNWGFQLDISDPKIADMDKLGTGIYEITKFRTTPGGEKDPSRESYHFYIGGTEIHLTGDAAAEVDRIEEELKQENPPIT